MSFRFRSGPERSSHRLFHCVVLLVGAILMTATAAAGILDRSEVQRRFGAPYQVQEKLRDIPV